MPVPCLGCVKVWIKPRTRPQKNAALHDFVCDLCPGKAPPPPIEYFDNITVFDVIGRSIIRMDQNRFTSSDFVT